MIDKIMSSPHRAIITLLTAVLLAVMHQYLFYDLDFGVSYPIFVILFYSFMYIFARDRLRVLTIMDAWIASVILLLSLTYLLFDNVLFQVLNFMVIPILVMLHLAYAMGRKKRQWWELRLIGTAIDHVLPQTIRHWGTIGSMMVRAGGRKMDKTQKVIVFKVLIGLLASIPFLLVMLTLLSSADGFFNAYLSGFPEWLDQFALMPMLPRIIWIIVAAIAALRIRYTKIPLIRCYIVLGLSAYTLMNYMGMDNRIEELNIERYHQTGNIDTAYLASLSADTLPLLKEFASKEFPELETHLMERKQVLDMHVKDASWVSFNFARHHARLDLSK